MKNILHIISNMGLNYLIFRIWYIFKKKTGLLALWFPKKYKINYSISLKEWKSNAKPFFFESKDTLGHFEISPEGQLKLKQEVEALKSGKIKFFSALTYDLGKDYNWHTNPETSYCYPAIHWTKINDYNVQQGDIKYVWEKSRFSYLYALIRYEQHFNQSQAEFVFSEIANWIDKNPLNIGPNYVCSQEISLRCMNWIFALYYYKNDKNLTDELFSKIIHSIYGQIKHVENNINFSRIAVRNNHALTETLFLYLAGTLFPFFKHAKKWKTNGLNYFEKEVLHQIYDDGTFIQYSMNYHRVAVQLFSWAMYLSQKNNEKINPKVLEKIQMSVDFLYQCQDDSTGKLPNYGANDGALFFPLNAGDFRNYSGQINGLYYFFNHKSLYTKSDLEEDIFWFAGKTNVDKVCIERTNQSYEKSGYFTLRNQDFFSFIRCGNHTNRPSQADNLHLDVWYKGNNILRDGGSYKYNASEEELDYFFGSKSHNLVTVNNDNQMLKGPRFVWYYWSKLVYWKKPLDRNYFVFEGRIKAFKHIGKIEHKRIVKQHFSEPLWEIEDTIFGNTNSCQQIWNISPEFEQLGFQIYCFDIFENPIKPQIREGFYASYYGKKEISTQIVFETEFRFFRTVVTKGLPI